MSEPTTIRAYLEAISNSKPVPSATLYCVYESHHEDIVHLAVGALDLLEAAEIRHIYPLLEDNAHLGLPNVRSAHRTRFRFIPDPEAPPDE